VRDDMRQRLAESFETALRHADGRAIAYEMDSGKEHLFSAKFACPVCSYSLQELEPRLFSFNNPMGACPKCDGLGVIQFFDPKRRRPPRAVAGRPARSRLGPAQPVLFPDAGVAGRALRLRRRTRRSSELPERIRKSCSTARARADRVPLPQRTRAASTAAHLRRHHPQPRTALQGNRLAGRARGAGANISNKTCPACNGTPPARRSAPRARRRQRPARNQPPAAGQARDFFENLLQLPGNKAQVAEKILKEITSRLAS
jgi:excinuclease ABC subunit A